jgi:hypothetical protein
VIVRRLSAITNSGKEDLAKCVQISCPMRSGFYGSVDVRRRRVGGRSPMLGVNHIYIVL